MGSLKCRGVGLPSRKGPKGKKVTWKDRKGLLNKKIGPSGGGGPRETPICIKKGSGKMFRGAQ